MSQPIVLIVEDDAILRLVIQRTVARFNSHTVVLTASGVSEARQQLRFTTPTVLITDFHLTDGTGLDVLLAVQECRPLPQRLAISGDVARADAVLAAGAQAFLAKPFGVNQLVALLGELAPGVDQRRNQAV